MDVCLSLPVFVCPCVYVCTCECKLGWVCVCVCLYVRCVRELCCDGQSSLEGYPLFSVWKRRVSEQPEPDSGTKLAGGRRGGQGHIWKVRF